MSNCVSISEGAAPNTILKNGDIPKRFRNTWSDGRPDKSVINSTFDDLEDEGRNQAGERIPKKKVAILLGFNGSKYHGMQFNPPHKTIESELFNAFKETKLVSKENLSDLFKVKFMRACRTDKGVHALGQVVSLKIIWRYGDLPDLGASELNKVLPDDIRVWAIKRVKSSFHAKNETSGRIYEYVMPTYMLGPADEKELKLFERPLSQEKIDAIKRLYRCKKGTLAGNSVSPTEEDQETESSSQKVLLASQQEAWESPKISNDELEKMKLYRISGERIDKLKSILNCFCGTNNFHNFTIGRPVWDKSAQRVIKAFNPSEPFINEDGSEWISLRIEGQSFMLHQIRKMVGLVILLMRTGYPEEIIGKLYGNVRVNIPKAPGLGLFLVETLYDNYNKQVNVLDKKQANFMGEKIDFSDLQQNMEEFKKHSIMNTISSEDKENQVFAKWLASIMNLAENFGYMQKDGCIPELYHELATIGSYHPDNQHSNKKRKQRDINQSRRKLRPDNSC